MRDKTHFVVGRRKAMQCLNIIIILEHGGFSGQNQRNKGKKKSSSSSPNVKDVWSLWAFRSVMVHDGGCIYTIIFICIIRRFSTYGFMFQVDGETSFFFSRA